MAGPWEKYQKPAGAPVAAQAPAAGPWTRYAKQPAAAANPVAAAAPLVPGTPQTRALDLPVPGQQGGLDPRFTPTSEERGEPVDRWATAGDILPAQRNRDTGEWRPAMPKIADSLIDAIMLPGDVATGKVNTIEFDPVDGTPYNSELVDRAANATGWLVGGVSPEVALGRRAINGEIPGALEKMIMEGGKPVPKAVTSALAKDGVPLSQVAKRVKDLGGEGVVADLGANVRDTAAALATSPGKGQATVVDALNARRKGAPERLTAALDENLGPAPTPSYLQTEIKANKRALGPEYDQALVGAGPVDTTDLAKSMDEMIPQLRGKAQTELQSVRSMLNAVGAKEGENPLAEGADVLFQVRQAIDGKMSDEMDGNVKRVLTGIREQVDSLLAEAVPGIKQIDAKYSELYRQSDAVDRGQTVLGNGRSDPRPNELADEVRAGTTMEGGPAGPSGVAFRLSQGARAEIDRLVGTNLNDRAALNSLLKGESDWNYQRLSTLFGKEKTDQLYRILENERAMALTENQATAGSKTASVTAAQREVNGQTRGAGPLQTLADAKPGTAAVKLADRVLGRFTAAQKDARNAEIAQALMSGGDWARQKSTGSAKTLTDDEAALMDAIFGRALGVSATGHQPNSGRRLLPEEEDIIAAAFRK